MDFTSLTAIFEGGLLAWLGLLIALVLRGILTGSINTAGLLSHSETAGGASAPERLALLIATLGYAAFYVMSALRMPLESERLTLPDIPEEVLAVFVGTNGLYLAGKIFDMRTRGG